MPDRSAVGPVDQLELLDADELDADFLDEVYTQVLQPNFPASELCDRAEFLACHARRDPEYQGVVAVLAGRPVGAAFGERHQRSGIVLLSYLAVLTEQRGLRVGGQLVARATDRWSARPGSTAVLAEIEDPRQHRDEGHGDPVARQRFYARAGARLVPVTYFQPSLRPGSPRVRGMLLVSLVATQDTLDAAALLAFLDDSVRASEGPPGADDAEYAAVRASVLRWAPTIELAPLGDPA